MRSFEDCQHRIDRAESHHEALTKAWNALLHEELYSVGVQVDSDGTGSIWVAPIQGVGLPPEFSLGLGEMIYQLRAALDGCIYQARIAETHRDPPPDEEKLEFPICSTAKEFGKKSALHLGPLAQERKAIVESVQPYNAPNLSPELTVLNFNRTLRILHDWARLDRHRKLHVIGSWILNASPRLRYPESVSLIEMSVSASGFMADHNQIATFKLAGFSRGMKVQGNPDLSIDIAVKESPPPCADNDTFDGRVRAMFMAVRCIVSSFENSF